MRMTYTDVLGTLYSAAGLRFGGFRTDEFLDATSALEAKRPGVREEIVAEAHYLAYWLHSFPEIGFVLGIAAMRSIVYACLFFIFAFLLEIGRFYLIGASPLLSTACWLWRWVKFPICVIVAILLWNVARIEAIILLAFIVTQGIWLLATAWVMLPIRLLMGRLVYRLGGQRQPQFHNMEGMTMAFVVERWQQALGHRM